MKSSKAEIINYKHFLKKSERPTIAPAAWSWNDIDQQLTEAFEVDPVSPGRAAVSLVHGATGDALGVCPNLNVLIQAFAPDTHGTPHRHSNFAIFIVHEGSGYSIIDGQKIEWRAGDVFFAPPWSRHEHCNPSSTDRAVLYTIQDVPAVAGMGTWFFQGADGVGFKHNLRQDQDE